MTVQWEISGALRDLTSGGIYSCYVGLSSAEVVNNISYEDSLVFRHHFLPDAENVDFIAYENLTEEIVISWVKDSIGEIDVAAKEQEIADIITLSKTNNVGVGLPW
jgi:hypothetical protein|tara:strand:- start:54 stop:371 length:318 start_codon:yes stop_codon:yes gene_type:complete